MQEKSPMMKQIESIPDLMKSMNGSLKESVHMLLQQIPMDKVKKIILTGCGDSYCAAMAAKFAFMEFTGIDTEAVPVIDLSRAYDRHRLVGDGDRLVVLVSNSGTVARVIELAKRIRHMGGTCVAVTGNMESGLSKWTDGVIRLQIPPFVYAPGIRSYCGCLLALYHLAVGLMPEEQCRPVWDELAALPEKIEAYMGTWEQQAKLYAEQQKEGSSFDFIGTGVQYATAWFGYAKALETTGKPAGASNTEDWFHMNYFIRDVAHTPIYLIVNEKDGSMSRAVELIRVAEAMRRTLICISDSDRPQAAKTIETPQTEYGALHGLIQYLPLSMILSEIGDLLGEVYFRDGKDNWSACVNGATITTGEEWILD